MILAIISKCSFFVCFWFLLAIQCDWYPGTLLWHIHWHVFFNIWSEYLRTIIQQENQKSLKYIRKKFYRLFYFESNSNSKKKKNQTKPNIPMILPIVNCSSKRIFCIIDAIFIFFFQLGLLEESFASSKVISEYRLRKKCSGHAQFWVVCWLNAWI